MGLSPSVSRGQRAMFSTQLQRGAGRDIIRELEYDANATNSRPYT